VLSHLIPPQCGVVIEAQRAHRLVEHGPGGLLLLDQEKLIFAHVFWSELIGRLAEMQRKTRDASDVYFDRIGRVIAQAQVFGHLLPQCSHDKGLLSRWSMGKAAAISGGNTGRNDLPQQCEIEGNGY
jgi:hypothetical protein